MLAGHIGVALGLKRVAPRLNLGVLVAASLLPDLALWVLVLLGFESAGIPNDYATTHQLEFTFPWSHGLVACVIAAAVAGAAVMAWLDGEAVARVRAGMAVEVAVVSHWILDALVHRPELPLLGDDSRNVGLALWNVAPIALAVEAAMVGLGLWLYARGPATGRLRPVVLVTLAALAMSMNAANSSTEAPRGYSSHG